MKKLCLLVFVALAAACAPSTPTEPARAPSSAAVSSAPTDSTQAGGTGDERGGNMMGGGGR
jgi:hypothetical protein